MNVQKVILPDGRPRFLLLDDEFHIVEPVKKFLKHLDLVGRSVYTLRSYAFHLKLYFEYLQEQNLTYLAVCEKGQRVSILSGFIGWLREWKNKKIVGFVAYRTNRTINVIMNTVLGFYRFLELNGDISCEQYFSRSTYVHYRGFLAELYNVADLKKSYFRLKQEDRVIKVLHRDQVAELVNACDSLRDKLLILVMFEGGLRLGEALNLQLEDFKVWKNQIRIQQHDKNPLIRVKNQNKGTLDMPSYVMQVFARYIAEEYPPEAGPSVFVNLKGKNRGQTLQPVTVEQKFRQLSKKCGFKVHPHMLRHAHATELIEIGGWDVLDVKTRLRHKQVQTTIDTYVHISPEYKRKKYKEFLEKLHDEDPDAGE